MNKVFLMGRLTNEPEVRITDSGARVCRYRIAVPREFRPKEADFFSCVAFNQAADFVAEYFSKGKGIIVLGRLTNNNYETKSGEKRYTTEITVERQYFPLGERAKTADSSEGPELFVTADDDDDDMPF